MRACFWTSPYLMIGVSLAGMIGHGTVSAQARPDSGRLMAPQEQHAVVTALIDEMNRTYVSSALAKTVERELLQDVRTRAFDEAITGPTLAERLTTRLRRLINDRHLAVHYSSDVIPVTPPPPTESAADELARDRFRNFSVAQVERLDLNIGYINLRGFAAAADARETIGAAMRLVAYTDALIIDLRGNGGGYPDGVAQLESYFFEGRTHLNDMQDRSGTLEETWTLDSLAGPRYGETRPVYLLTSRKTFSGGEDMAYTMQQLKRATIVGEVTGGGANPGAGFRLGEHFEAFIPFARAVNPITKTNWEGTGVQPDLVVPADRALPVARLAALEQLLQREQDPQRRAALTAAIAQLKQTP